MNNITFDYEIEALGVHNTLNEKNNVVYEIRVFLVGKNKIVTENTESESILKEYFVVHVPTNDLQNFIEYEQLTKQNVIEWIEKYSNSLKSHKNNLIEKFHPKKQYLKPNFL
jgi:hypothetical protein